MADEHESLHQEVHADPFFRYSVRVDGVFEPDFLEKIRETSRRR